MIAAITPYQMLTVERLTDTLKTLKFTEHIYDECRRRGRKELYIEWESYIIKGEDRYMIVNEDTVKGLRKMVFSLYMDLKYEGMEDIAKILLGDC